ncbi:MAG: alpha-glucosidase [Pseudomonadota bacterium]
MSVSGTDDWWRGAVIYQIYPRSFADHSGDGTGDLPGITERLPYLAELGVDGIWLSPFFTSPMKDFGYDVADYRDVDPTFGTLADFDALLARAHELGLKVIIDQVYSHTSDQHAWFAESRSSRDNARADWYVWADPKPDGTPPNNWLATFGGVSWTWDAHRQQYYLHNFLPEQPDLNFHNPQVREAILEVARFWLDRGVDGFRLDVANFYFHNAALPDNPPAGNHERRPRRAYTYQQHLHDHTQPENLAFLAELRAVLDSYGARMTVGEIGAGFDVSAEYTRGRNRLHTCYNFTLLNARTLDATLIANALEPWNAVDAWPSWSFSNHDVPRATSRFGRPEDPAFAKLLIALLVTLRGTAFLYQGEELGLPQAEVPFEALQDPEAINNWPHTLGRDGARTPMPWQRGAPHAGFSKATPWLPVDPAHDALAVSRQDLDPDSVLNFTRRLLTARRSLPALIAGDIEFLPAPDDTILFRRAMARQSILCAFNLSATAVRIPSIRKPGAMTVIDSGLTGTLDGAHIALDAWQGCLVQLETGQS